MNILQSSKDPQKLSRTVEGVVVAVLTAVAAISFHFFGVDISSETTKLGVVLQDVAVIIGSLYSAIVMIYGIVAKVINKFSPKKV